MGKEECGMEDGEGDDGELFQAYLGQGRCIHAPLKISNVTTTTMVLYTHRYGYTYHHQTTLRPGVTLLGDVNIGQLACEHD